MRYLYVLVFCLAGCGGPDFWIGETEIFLEGDVEPWEDFPDVMWHLQNDAEHQDIPDEVWRTRFFFRPAGHPHPEMEPYQAAACFFQWETQWIYMRPTGGSTHEGCLAHELAHRWVDLKGLDKHCDEADIHDCPGWIDRNKLLRSKVCPHSWAKNIKDDECPEYVYEPEVTIMLED